MRSYDGAGMRSGVHIAKLYGSPVAYGLLRGVHATACSLWFLSSFLPLSIFSSLLFFLVFACADPCLRECLFHISLHTHPPSIRALQIRKSRLTLCLMIVAFLPAYRPLKIITTFFSLRIFVIASSSVCVLWWKCG